LRVNFGFIDATSLAASSAVSGALGAYAEYMDKSKEHMAKVEQAAQALGQSPVVGSGA